LKIRTTTGPDVWTVLGQQTSIKGGGFSVNMVDATHEESTDAWGEVVAGIVKAKEWVIGMNFVPGGTAQALILSKLRELCSFRTVFPDGSYVSFSGYFSDSDPDMPLDDKMVDSITITPSGAMTVVAAAAPVSDILPAISGALEVDADLTAYEGVWDHEPTLFTYQWKNAGVAINGATGKTYTVIEGDAGDSITVTVTAANSAGSASATSSAVIIAS
jgi:hypothetical protein